MLQSAAQMLATRNFIRRVNGDTSGRVSVPAIVRTNGRDWFIILKRSFNSQGTVRSGWRIADEKGLGAYFVRNSFQL
jgi:hypothetical protein